MILPGMKVGIVVPYSWSFWGGVPEHAQHQARALGELGIETRTLIGYDPPGVVTRVLHPRAGRGEPPPAGFISTGRSAIVLANGALPNVVLDPRAFFRVRAALERERFDVVHVHEPLAPVACLAALALARVPVVGTFHAAGDLAWMKGARPLFGFLAERLDYRIAVSEAASEAAARHLGGQYELIPNGVLIPPRANVAARDNHVVFIGRHEPRKGLEVLLRAWPEVHASTGARLRLVGADPSWVRLLLSRRRLPETGIDFLGTLAEQELTAELLRARALAAPSLGGESFGMVLTRAFACGAPVVASDIPGYRDVMAGEAGALVPPGDGSALAAGLVELLGDEKRRLRLAQNARRIAEERYAWPDIARRLAKIYHLVAGSHPATRAAA
jgi:phosphatidylinositol alpha-mannosyltransferase